MGMNVYKLSLQCLLACQVNLASRPYLRAVRKLHNAKRSAETQSVLLLVLPSMKIKPCDACLKSIRTCCERMAHRGCSAQGHGNSNASDFARKMYPFCTLVFSSWDFHISSREAASVSRRAIRSQLKELVSDIGIQERYLDPTAVATAKARKVSAPAKLVFLNKTLFAKRKCEKETVHCQSSLWFTLKHDRSSH